MSFTNFTTGHSHSFGGQFLELAPNERIRHTDKFDDPSLPGEMETTISLKKVSCGTEVNIVQEGIPEAIPSEACSLGWQESLILLAQLIAWWSMSGGHGRLAPNCCASAAILVVIEGPP